MKFLTTFIGLTAVFCAFGGANAALRVGGGANTDGVSSGRVSVASASTVASRRIPTMVSGTTLVTTTTTTSSSLMTDTECVDAYTECIRDPEVCGSEFEECTTSELFYAQKPKCNNVLLQCSSAGINTLFGTASTGNLATKNSNGEYVYPTAASVLGQFIEAGAINNRLDTSSCVKRYTSCLKKESVCGNDFELCTTNSEFKKQKLFCESTLARCQDEGKTELFGSTNTSSNPTAASRLGIMIKEGGDLAAVNAVSTCYKVVDQCFLGACSENPYKCIVDSNSIISDITDAINAGRALTPEQATAIADARTSAQVAAYIKNSCLETIGGNKYCYATFLGNGQMPTAAQLRDEDNRDEVYAEAYSARMNASMREKISQIADKFDKKTKDKCVDTIMSCAMRSCGGGLGSACYQLVFRAGNSMSDLAGTINGQSTYQEIKTGCEAIVNTDVNCQYAAASANETAFNYNYSESGTFGTVFPTSDTGKDPLGVVARLNGALAENYNDAAIDRMAKQCRNTAVSCIRSLCGADFVNCYRNRTDIMTDTYDTEETKFNQSMNKVGGVLDFTIVRGLCLETVKSADVCDEHLKIQSIRYNTDNGAAGWGNKSSVRDAWVDAVKDGYSAKSVEIDGEFVETGLCTIDQSKTQSAKCKAKITNAQECDTVDEDGCLYDVEQVVARTDYQVSMAADTLFQEVMGDLEKEAQAKYNAKLTAEQHMCIDANNGGIMGRNDISGTYMWVKLRGRKVPKDYSTNGLKVNDFTASNDLYGSFCRARVTIQSDDPDIQSELQNGQNWSTAYFAVGDVFTCGSWIPQDKLQAIAEKAAAKKLGKSVDDAKAGTMSTGQKWATAAATIGSAGLGAVGMDLLQTRTGLGGLVTSRNTTTSEQREIGAAIGAIEAARDANCPTRCSGNNKCFNASSYFVGSYLVKSYNYISNAANAGSYSCQDLTKEVNKMYALVGVNSETGDLSGNWWQNYGKRATVDTVGAIGLGITGGLATGKNIKAANRQEFTEAQQEFMNNVGNHIYCFIGADEAGTYGDLIEISVE